MLIRQCDVAGFNNGSGNNLVAMADNLDMKEMAYTPSVKDMTETRVRHMLTENMFMPKARVSEYVSDGVRNETPFLT